MDVRIAPYTVKTPKRLAKIVRDMPYNAVKTLAQLIEDLKELGPIRPEYPNYSKLGAVSYHCHLAYSWVACWRCENNEYIVEVEYVGSREKAPY